MRPKPGRDSEDCAPALAAARTPPPTFLLPPLPGPTLISFPVLGFRDYPQPSGGAQHPHPPARMLSWRRAGRRVEGRRRGLWAPPALEKWRRRRQTDQVRWLSAVISCPREPSPPTGKLRGRGCRLVPSPPAAGSSGILPEYGEGSFLSPSTLGPSQQAISASDF